MEWSACRCPIGPPRSSRVRCRARRGIKVALKLRRAGIPLFAFEFGTAQEEPDIIIGQARGYQIIPFDPKLRLDLTLQSPGFADKEATVSIRRQGRLLHERTVRLNGKDQHLTIDFDSPYEGFHEYTAQVSELPGERLSENNRYGFGADLRDEKIRVIYMEGATDATHNLENALEEDPHIEVTSLFFPQNSAIELSKKAPYQTDTQGRRIYNVAHPDRGFPTDMESLLRYDVVINSDIYREAFTPEQLQNTVSLVEEFGGGFVMIGGQTAFGAGLYDKTVIDKLMPVDVYGNRDSSWSGFRLAIPEEAYAHPIMQVGATDEETRKAWTEHFPGFSGLNKVNRLKPGAVSLALHDTEKNQYGPLVVFAVQQIGRGRTMAFTSDTTYGWGASFAARFGNADDPIVYYRQFWNNAVRWLAADRIQRKAGELRIETPNNRVRLGESATIDILSASERLHADIRLKIIQPDKTEIELSLESSAVQEERSASFRPTQTGPHHAIAQLVKSEDESIFAREFIDMVPNNHELETTRTNPELLRTMAEITNGRFFPNSGQTLDDAIPRDLSVELVEYRESSIWDRWWFLLLLAAFLGSEWFLRRRWGLA